MTDEPRRDAKRWSDVGASLPGEELAALSRAETTTEQVVEGAPAEDQVDPAGWQVSTHEWAVQVDREHLDHVRAHPGRYAPGGWVHLVCEVLAYADDEAAATGRRGRATVTVHPDRSVEVRDDGRGTDTRVTGTGRRVRKPVACTPDVRFAATEPAVVLPDGHRRWGLSVVAATSEWLVHTNHRVEGSWSQRYERGVPVTGLVPVRATGGSGTGIRFRPVDAVDLHPEALAPGLLFPHLTVAWPPGPG